MRNLLVDAGNHRVKAAVFEGGIIMARHEWSPAEFTKWISTVPADHFLLSSVAGVTLQELDLRQISGQRLQLNPSLPLPLQVAYQTPETLGADRLAAACGAAARFPKKNSLVIDVGTCINYELVTADRTYRGGAISPGVRMRFLAMHQQTARLPLAEPIPKAPLIGQSTVTCLQSGVLNGVVAEMAGMIARYEMQCSGQLHVILCGGDAQLFENQLKGPIFVAPDLVLEGLNSILEHNVAT